MQTEHQSPTAENSGEFFSHNTKTIINEYDPELLSIHALNFSQDKDSASRAVMFGSHFSQRLVISGATEKRIQTGVEQDLSKYTFSVKMPVDGRIIKVIDRYPRRLDIDSIPENPEVLVIYEDEKTHELGCINIPRHASYHQYFGFKYDIKGEATRLFPGNFVPKDTIFADSPSVSENGGYKYGIELNMAFMSHPAVSEDGILISEDVLDRLKFKVYETRVVEFGSGSFPLNLYGNADTYKPFPEIGEYIRSDGILMMLRQYDYDLMPVEISVLDVMEPDYIFDKAVYVRGPEGKVVDIKVYRDNNDVSQTPSGIMDNVEKYSRALQSYYREILDTIRQIRAERKKKFGTDKVATKPELHRLLVEGMAILSEQNGKSTQRLSKVFRKAPLDDYRIEFTIEYELTPTSGFKMTASHGDKGVICHIEKPENMPVDADGVRADVVMDAGSTISRMNLGRLYEQYFGSAAMKVSRKVREMTGIAECSAVRAKKELQKLDPNYFASVVQYVLDFYRLISIRQYNFYSKEITQDEQYDHIAGIIEKGVYIYYPTDNEYEMSDVVRAMEADERYRPTYAPVTYVGNSGKRVTTEVPVRIGPLYMMLLEKIADDWSSVSSGKLQHFGILSPMTKSEKYAYPFRNSPVRTIGETEGRIFAGYCGREAIAEMLDRSNNPNTHKHMVWNILTADKPTNIETIVDRNVIPLGGSKPLQLVNHISVVSGFRPVYEKPDNF